MSHKIHSKPSLDAEGFQRLLAAAFILQSRAEWIARKPVRTVDVKRFAARAIAQQTTHSIRPSLAQPGAWGEADAVSRLSGPMLWKTVEALAIASVFCLMMGISIHHLLADPRGSSPAGMLQTRDAGRLTSSTSQPDATRKSRQSQDEGEGERNTYDEDLVIHYRPRTANLPGSIGKAMRPHRRHRHRSRSSGALININKRSGATVCRSKDRAHSAWRFGIRARRRPNCDGGVSGAGRSLACSDRARERQCGVRFD